MSYETTFVLCILINTSLHVVICENYTHMALGTCSCIIKFIECLCVIGFLNEVKKKDIIFYNRFNNFNYTKAQFLSYNTKTTLKSRFLACVAHEHAIYTVRDVVKAVITKKYNLCKTATLKKTETW